MARAPTVAQPQLSKKNDVAEAVSDQAIFHQCINTSIFARCSVDDKFSKLEIVGVPYVRYVRFLTKDTVPPVDFDFPVEGNGGEKCSA